MSELIDREKAIDALWKAMYEYEDKMEKQFIESDDLDIEEWIQHRVFVQNMSDIDRKAILDLPSAEPERKTGEWKPFDRTWGRSIYHCTACGEAEDCPTEMGRVIWRFCPNCGAKMDGGGDDVTLN